MEDHALNHLAPLPSDALRSWLIAWLPRQRTAWHRLRLGWLWSSLARYVSSGTRPLRLSLHGQRALINAGNPYPFLLFQFPFFNRPLVELVRQVAARRSRALTVVDVGGSIGNTALLLFGAAPHAIARLVSIEGDVDFFRLLEFNTAGIPAVVRHRAMLARAAGLTHGLVHHHAGTATARGVSRVSATTLDDLLAVDGAHYDVLKIDVDGSDGEVLAGAAKLLTRDQPAVIFEWHPYLVAQAGNSIFAAFEVLREHGYRDFLWFHNTGHFSHFGASEGPDLELWRSYLNVMQPHGDPHFDVVALPPALADLKLPLASFGIAH